MLLTRIVLKSTMHLMIRKQLMMSNEQCLLHNAVQHSACIIHINTARYPPSTGNQFIWYPCVPLYIFWITSSILPWIPICINFCHKAALFTLSFLEINKANKYSLTHTLVSISQLVSSIVQRQQWFSYCSWFGYWINNTIKTCFRDHTFCETEWAWEHQESYRYLFHAQAFVLVSKKQLNPFWPLIPAQESYCPGIAS